MSFIGQSILSSESLAKALVGVNIVNVEDGTVSRDMVVDIHKGVFGEIRKMSKDEDGDGDRDLKGRDGLLRIDAKGLYMCPGLIDCEWDSTHPSSQSGMIGGQQIYSPRAKGRGWLLIPTS
jgi:hypothetical protein